ncbi:MAG: transporter substrate-binding domain-containing protein [Telluria sp.]
MPSIPLVTTRWLLSAWWAMGCAVPAASTAATITAPLEVVIVGVFAMEPYVHAGPDAPTGALIDFFDHEVAPRMGVRFQWERPMTTARLEQSLISGRVMFTPILARTPSRERSRIRYAGAPYVLFAPCIAVLADSPLGAVLQPGDLAGKTVGWVQGGALPTFMLDKRIRLDRIGAVDWSQANLSKLRLGRIDAAYFSNSYTPRYFAARGGVALKLLPLPVKKIELYGAFSPKVPASLAERYTRAASEAFAGDRFSTYLQKAVEAN